MHPYAPANSTFDGPVANMISILCILIEVLSGAHAERRKGLNDFESCAFTGRFPDDTLTRVAVKGLTTDGRGW